MFGQKGNSNRKGSYHPGMGFDFLHAMKTYAVLILVIGDWVCGAVEESCILAWTESGSVCGARKLAVGGVEYASFLGIPYAKAPLRELRFAEPQRPDDFVGVFNATIQQPWCPQFIMRTPASLWNEDCLWVNIHAPLAAVSQSQEPKSFLPVLVIVHGGSFAFYAGNPDMYGPEYLITKDIIVVTMNYRLGPIGFLFRGSKYIPGNAGLRDIRFSLEWVQRNIRNFGGDPDQVTLGGYSSGATLAHLLTMSPAAQGLFKRSMALGGNGLFVTPQAAAKNTSDAFLKFLGISPSESEESIFEKLTQAPIEKLLEADELLSDSTIYNVIYQPVIETPQPGFTTIVPKNPKYLMEKGYGKENNMLIGFTNNECLPFKHLDEMFDLIGELRKNTDLILPQYMLEHSDASARPGLIKMISDKYYNSTYPTQDHYSNFCSDRFKANALTLVRERLAMGAAPTYTYEFSYPSENSVLNETLKVHWDGAGHIEDISYFIRFNYLADSLKADELSGSDPDSRMRNWMTTFVANFVKTGQPTSNPSDWPPSTDQLEYQSISEPMKYSFGPATPYLVDKMHFFNALEDIALKNLKD